MWVRRIPRSFNKSVKKVSRQDVEKNGKLALELPRRKFFHAKYFPEIPLDLKKTSFLKGKVQFSILWGVWYGTTTHRRTWNVSNKGGLEKLAILSPFKCSLMSVVKRERKRSFNCHHKRIEKEFLKPFKHAWKNRRETYIHIIYGYLTTLSIKKLHSTLACILHYAYCCR